MRFLLLLLFISLSSFEASAQTESSALTDLSLIWSLPFVAILASIALLPIITPRLWHHHYGKIIAFWTLLFMLPFGFYFGFSALSTLALHAILEEYIPFILLLLALFTVSGGIYIQSSFQGSTRFNVILLLIGTLLASIMGTTGAAMLLIRPLLKANRARKHKVHTIVFFIFLVANIGGGLTSLGDPPLFIGFLKGVSFSWTLLHLFLPIAFNAIILLCIYIFIDRFFIQKEQFKPEKQITTKCQIYGQFNFILLAAIIGAVLLSGIWQAPFISIFGSSIPLQNIVRDLLFIFITFLSFFLTPKQVRAGNEFNWEPILEVAKLFIGIFITIVPVIAILKAGDQGALSAISHFVTDEAQNPIPIAYFWLCGLLSGFLDNAPTYLIFFNLAGGNAPLLMTDFARTLLAISMGSVFMGALTYIGNAPNLMVKNLAQQAQIKMPSFLGYLKWSFLILLPLFILDGFLFLLF